MVFTAANSFAFENSSEEVACRFALACTCRLEEIIGALFDYSFDSHHNTNVETSDGCWRARARTSCMQVPLGTLHVLKEKKIVQLWSARKMHLNHRARFACKRKQRSVRSALKKFDRSRFGAQPGLGRRPEFLAGFLSQVDHVLTRVDEPRAMAMWHRRTLKKVFCFLFFLFLWYALQALKKVFLFFTQLPAAAMNDETMYSTLSPACQRYVDWPCMYSINSVTMITVTDTTTIFRNRKIWQAKHCHDNIFHDAINKFINWTGPSYCVN